MAVNETIVTGRKFRKLTDAASKKWQRISFWHKASDCEFNDGKTAEEKLGAIKGITTDLNVTVPGYAADATRVSELNNSLNGYSFGYTVDGKPGYREAGADTVVPFKSTEIIYLGTSSKFNVSSYGDYEKFTKDNFIVEIISLPRALGPHTGYYSPKQGVKSMVLGTTIGKNYNAATGELTLSGISQTACIEQDDGVRVSFTSQALEIRVYLVLS